MKTPDQWQTDSTQITTETVQFWACGNLVTAQMRNNEARKLVESGNAFVVNEQAIGLLDEGSMRA